MKQTHIDVSNNIYC